MPVASLETCRTKCINPEKIAEVKGRMDAEGDLSDLAEIFKVLGDYTRVRILQALMHAELCVCDIAALLELSQSAVSHQLRLLRTARLVKFRRSGKAILYSLDDVHVENLFAEGLKHVQEG